MPAPALRILCGFAASVAAGALAAPAAALAPYAPAPVPAPSPYVADLPTATVPLRDGPTGRLVLGGTWLYRADPSDSGLTSGYAADVTATAGWNAVAVPNAANAGDFSDGSMAGVVGWYRKDFRVPQADVRTWVIRFESVNNRAQVWLNGRPVGAHGGGSIPFELDLHPRPGVNRLIVRVDGRHTAADLPPGAFGGSPYVGGWWNFGGILREVLVRPAAEADIPAVRIRATFPCASCFSSTALLEQATVRNVTARELSVHLRGRFGAVGVDFGRRRLAPGESWIATATAQIAHPRLWSPDDPHLYRATFTLTDSAGRRVAGYAEDVGVRRIAVSGGRLTLNGRPLSLRGLGLHEQDLPQGAALDRSHLLALFSAARALHAGLLRSHYPLSEQILEAADRAGVLVWSEIPVYQVNSAYLAQRQWQLSEAQYEQSAITADADHPSVLLWSIGNELANPPDGPEARYIAAAAAQARALDPSRPVGMAIRDWPGVPCQPDAYGPLDVIGYNDYFGWYDAGAGGTADREQLGPFLDFLRTCYPAKALLVTEFGFEANRDGPVEERGTYAFQTDAIAYHLSVFDARPWLSGAILWALEDFACRPAWGGGNPISDPPFFHKGLLDLTGNPKPAFAAVAAAYAAHRQIG